MLNRSADTAGDIEIGTDRHTCLTDLVIVIDPSGINSSTGCTHFAAQRLRQIVDQFEVFFAADTVAAGNNDPRTFQVNRFFLTDTLNDFHDCFLCSQRHIHFDDFAGGLAWLANSRRIRSRRVKASRRAIIWVRVSPSCRT